MSDQDEFAPGTWEPTPGIVAAEMAVAGAAMQWRTAVEEAAELVKAEDFYSPAGQVYAAASTSSTAWSVWAAGRTCTR
jgi:hypothetical protein